MKISKKKMVLAVIAAIIATVITTGLTAFKADAAGGPRLARCWSQTPTLKGVSWQASNDYWSGPMPAPWTPQSVLSLFTWDFQVKNYVKANGKAAPSKVFMTFSGASKAIACYESYIWDQMYDENGAPMQYSDGTPVLYQRIASSYWTKVNPNAFQAWSIPDFPRKGDRGIALAAWVVGGK